MASDPPMSPCGPDGDSAAHTATTAAGDDPEAPSSSLVKSVGQLASGRAVAVAATLLTTPIIARLYGENDFGIAGIVSAIAILLYPFTSGFCYYLAMPLARSISERRAVFVVSVVLGLLATSLVAAVALIGGEWIATACGRPELGAYVIFVPLFGLCLTLANSTRMVLNCEKKFGHVAIRSTVQNMVMRAVQIAAGLAGLGYSAAGLLLGAVSGFFARGLTLSAGPVRSLLRGGGKRFEISQLKSAAVKYKNFPLFRMWSEMVYCLMNSFPMLFMGFFFSLQVSGYYSLARAILFIPLRLFTATSREVFYVEVAHGATCGESTADTTSQLLRLLSVLTAFPFMALFVLGPLLFEVVLGARWHEAGVYAQILIPSIAVLCIGQPLAVMFDATNRMAEGLIYNIGLLAVQAGLMLLGGFFFGARVALACYTIGTVLVWTGILVRTIGLAGVGRVRAARMLTAPYIEAILLLSPAGVLYWGFEMKIAALIALGVAGMVQATIIHARYPQIRRKFARIILRR